MDDVEVDGYGSQVVGGGIQLQDLKPLLDKAKEQCDEVAPQHTLANQERGEVEENPADADIRGTHRLKHADHVGPFQDDDQEARDHGEPRDDKHQDDNDPHVHVQQVEPVKYHGVNLLDGAGVERVAQAVGVCRHLEEKVL